MREIAFLWVNLSALSALGTVAGTTSPLMWMLMDGDELLPGAYMHRGGCLDDNWVVVKTANPERARILADGISVIAKAKLCRKPRIRITAKAPGASWRWVAGG